MAGVPASFGLIPAELAAFLSISVHAIGAPTTNGGGGRELGGGREVEGEGEVGARGGGGSMESKCSKSKASIVGSRT